MAAPTPEQMRALAEQHAERASWESIGGGKRWYENTADALRTAANQLEAVQALYRHDIGGEFWVAASPLDAILAAGTASQGDR